MKRILLFIAGWIPGFIVGWIAFNLILDATL